MNAPKIVCVSLSPDDKRIYSLGEPLRLGLVNRAATVLRTTGGKAVNAAAAIGSMRENVCLCGFLGGNAIKSFSEKLEAKGVSCRFVQTAAPTRTCVTILEEGRATELVENAPRVSQEELREFKKAFAEAAVAARILVLAGSVPPGCALTLYADLIRSAPKTQIIVDAQGELLLAAVEAGVTVAKPNKHELASTFGERSTDPGTTVRLMRELQKKGAETVVVTDGEQPVLMAAGNSLFEIVPPKISAKNAIGAGDVLAGGIAVGLKRGMAIEQAVTLGVAMASASAETLIPAEFSREEAQRLTGSVSCRMTQG